MVKSMVYHAELDDLFLDWIWREKTMGLLSAGRGMKRS
jgi:hypothetical protein